jgi:hypothetical protein
MRVIRAISTMSALAVLAFAAPARAQTAAIPDQDVMAVINRMFEGFAKKDTTIIRGTLAEDVKLVSAFNNREGKPMVHAETMDKFLVGIATAPGTLDERLFNPEVRIDGNLATVWVKYEFWYDGKYSHCGFDAFQLARGEAGWKIISIADTRRPKCE